MNRGAGHRHPARWSYRDQRPVSVDASVFQCSMPPRPAMRSPTSIIRSPPEHDQHRSSMGAMDIDRLSHRDESTSAAERVDAAVAPGASRSTASDQGIGRGIWWRRWPPDEGRRVKSADILQARAAASVSCARGRQASLILQARAGARRRSATRGTRASREPKPRRRRWSARHRRGDIAALNYFIATIHQGVRQWRVAHQKGLCAVEASI